MPTDRQKLAETIHRKRGALITIACEGTPVPPELLAGLISVENAALHEWPDPRSTRFERHVYNALVQVRNGVRLAYNGIRAIDLRNADEAAIRNLATSWGDTQILGLHVIRNLRNKDGSPVKIEQLRDPKLHLGYAAQLLEKVAGTYLRTGDYESVLRIWNTGTPSKE